VPGGIEIQTQEEKFSYTIKRNNNGKEKTGDTSEPISKSAIVV
jgi:hypothetical protein